jgi:acetyl esterase/lipase
MRLRSTRSTLLLATVCLLIANASARCAYAAPPVPLNMPPAQLLWPSGAPGAVGDADTDKPALFEFLPPADKANGAAVIVCPGGGYGGLAMSYEGKDVAEWFNTLGVTAFVLRYRLAPNYHHPVPLNDAQRAMRTVRAGAAQWKIDPNRIGILGFSAGGHLASTLGTHFDAGKSESSDPIEQVSCRPDFLVLCYPVIAMATPYGHAGSKKNLLGANPDPAVLASLSNETQVTDKTPPTFLFHTSEDTAVPPENSVLFYLALRQAKVPAEMHIYEHGRHGVGLGQNDPVLATWPGSLADWLKGRGLLRTDVRGVPK